MSAAGVGAERASNYALGIFFLSVYLMAGVIFSLVIQLIGTGQEGAWAKPYFESFLFHAIWILVIPIAAIIYFAEKKIRSIYDAEKKNPYPEVPWRVLFIWGLYSGPSIVISSVLYFMSLSRLPLALCSAIAQCYFLIVFGISVIVFASEKITLFRICSTIICLGGLVFAAISGMQNSGSSGAGKLLCCTWSGYIFLFSSMILSAIYQIVWSYLMAPIKENFGKKSIFLGFAGLASTGFFSLVIGWIGVVVGDFSGWEKFELPPSGPALDGVLISCGMDFLLNAANLLSMLFVSPVFVSVGSLLLIPLNTFAQLVIVRTSISGMGWAGMALIMIGCLAFEISDILVERFRKKKEAADRSLLVTAADAVQEDETNGLINT